MLNKIILMGRLTKEPEYRTTQAGKPVASFTLAVDRDYDREKADFFSCTAWGKTDGTGLASFIARNFHKGDAAIVAGEMQARKWQDDKGNNRVSWEVQVQNIWFGGTKRQDEPRADVAPVLVEEDDDGELPF